MDANENINGSDIYAESSYLMFIQLFSVRILVFFWDVNDIFRVSKSQFSSFSFYFVR